MRAEQCKRRLCPRARWVTSTAVLRPRLERLLHVLVGARRGWGPVGTERCLAEA